MGQEPGGSRGHEEGALPAAREGGRSPPTWTFYAAGGPRVLVGSCLLDGPDMIKANLDHNSYIFNCCEGTASPAGRRPLCNQQGEPSFPQLPEASGTSEDTEDHTGPRQ